MNPQEERIFPGLREPLKRARRGVAGETLDDGWAFELGGVDVVVEDVETDTQAGAAREQDVPDEPGGRIARVLKVLRESQGAPHWSRSPIEWSSTTR